MKIKHVLATAVLVLSTFAQAQTAQQPDKATSAPDKGCLAVQSVGSHAFRNIFLAGVAGGLISKEQYKVVKVVNYPAKNGQKFHGNDLQVIQNNGTKVIILDKKATAEDAQKTCQ
jgi:hypothetical protein